MHTRCVYINHLKGYVSLAEIIEDGNARFTSPW